MVPSPPSNFVPIRRASSTHLAGCDEGWDPVHQWQEPRGQIGEAEIKPHTGHQEGLPFASPGRAVRAGP